MTHRITRFLLRQKLLLGVLWLMLRGSSADGQRLYNPKAYCYLAQKKEGLFSHLDMSLGTSISNDKATNLRSDFSFGRNYSTFTSGLNVDYTFDKSILFGGPYFRVFSANISRDSLPANFGNRLFNIFLEGKYSFAINKSFDNSGFSITTGLIFFTKTSNRSVGRCGIEVFESFSNIVCDRRKYFFSTGIRIHYYINE